MDLRAILDHQRTGFTASLPEPVAVRRDRLERAAAMVRDHADRFCASISHDFGHRSREQTLFTDIAGSIAPIVHAIKNLDRWVRPESRPVKFPLALLGAKAWVEYQPLGVVGVMAPWNFPLNLVMSPLAGIFAAGNRAMVKVSEYTPATASLLEDLCPHYFAPEELAIVSGGPEIGKAFAALPFDHLLFTGATTTARDVLRAAAGNLTPVTLELGGKSPAIIGARADIAQATARIALGKMLNAGQVCLAPDYVMVPAGREQAVVDGLKTAVARMYPSLLSNADYTAIVNDRHYRRLQEWIDDAQARGASVEVVETGGEDFAGSNSRKMPLHILRNVTDDMIVMREEIFGPILPILLYDGIDEAIARVNRGDRPLALYYFGPDANERRRVLDRTHSGGVTLDDVLFHNAVEDLPFGGVGASGMGSYHGRDGFRTFSHARAVYRQSKLDIAGLAGLTPPYGTRTRKAAMREISRGARAKTGSG